MTHAGVLRKGVGSIPVEEPAGQARRRQCCSLVLSDAPSMPERVRAAVGSVLGAYPEECVLNAQLVADALVTDVYHAGAAAGATVRLLLMAAGAQLRIELDCPDVPSRDRAASSAVELGRLLLEQCTTDWGVHRQEEGHTTTWAVLDLGP